MSRSQLQSVVLPALCLSVLLLSCSDGSQGGPAGPPRAASERVALGNAAADLDQCANGPLSAPVECTTAGAWVNGNLNQNQAHYLEGEAVPYRLRFSNLEPGSTTHTVRIEWDTSVRQASAAHHALDYLTSVNASELTADPCAGVTGCVNTQFTTVAVAADPWVAAGADGVAGTSDDLAQVAGSFRLYGGTLLAVSGYTHQGTLAGTSQASLTLTFTAQRADPVLAWGGHIARRVDWSPQLTAVHIPGSPYHMRLLDLDGQGGNQDRSLAAAAVHTRPELIVIKHVINDNGATKVAADFTLSVTATSPSPSSFPGVEAPGTTVIIEPGAYAVSELAHEGYAVSYSAECSGTLDYDQVATCTVTNDDSNLCLTVECAPPAGACLEPGVCDPGTGSCTYAVKAAGVLCRAAAGVCDEAETCDGATGACPEDGFKAETEICRASAGVCDVAEACTGASAACPGDAKSTAVCRGVAGICDVAESCNGTSAECPGDGFVAATTECRASAGICDVAELCTGTRAACPGDGFLAATTECRASAGICDVAESCTGTTAACPGDVKSHAECRASAGTCDVAEVCDGTADDCPEDGFVTSGTSCRAAAGACDLEERCTGSAAECPGDAKSTAVCRATAGACDQPESCDGVQDTCPGDAVLAAGTECRASTDACDPVETCTGSSGACPGDVSATCSVCGAKFYDANTNAAFDATETTIAGWQLTLARGTVTTTATTDLGGGFRFDGLAEGDYQLCERSPVETSWLQTFPVTGCYAVHVPSTEAASCGLDFGNVCLGAGGGHTIGFWSNPNGQAAFRTIQKVALPMLRDLPLVTEAGAAFDPRDYAALKTWLNRARATNMAYMLSAQLAAMELSLLLGSVPADAVLFAPGTQSAADDPLGFTTVGELVAESTAELATPGHQLTLSGSAFRAYQAALEQALNGANKNEAFRSSTPCTFSFAAP